MCVSERGPELERMSCVCVYVCVCMYVCVWGGGGSSQVPPRGESRTMQMRLNLTPTGSIREE